ncbi:MAG TPA: hypothetical protein VEW48_03550 [Thermoanaerobaculia bacterium]|nr:hypothetical protein [Thermoanaerobaculia bacterium]
MSERQPLLRDLIRSFFPDYLRLVEPDSAAQMWLERIAFPAPKEPPEPDGDDLGDLGVVAEVTSRRGETVTVVARIEPEALAPPEIAKRLGRHLMELEVCYGQPVLTSVLYLNGGRSGIHLESGVIGEACGIELVRIYYTIFSLAETRAEPFLDRPEPLAWAFAALMRPTKRTPEEHRRACLERIAAAPLDEDRRLLLRQAVETFLPRPGVDLGVESRISIPGPSRSPNPRGAASAASFPCDELPLREV